MDEVAEHTKAVLAVRTPKNCWLCKPASLQPSAEKAAAYGRHLYDIASSTSSEVSKLAESQIADAQKSLCPSLTTP